MRTILVVDDNNFNLKIVNDALSDSFNIISVKSGDEALEFLKMSIPDLILLDINMPGMDGKITLKKIKANNVWNNIPIIFLTVDSSSETEADCLLLGGDDFIQKPFVPAVMKSRITRVLELWDLRNGLKQQLEEKTKQLEKVTLDSFLIIANTVDAKDKYTSGHSIRVARYSEAIARYLGVSDKEIQNLHYIALLHDIGKIGVPDSILNKPSQLTPEEFEIIQKHTTLGGDILKDIHMIPFVEEGALYHHERYDGTGYPKGLKGQEIPFNARIVCIADSYDAMTSDRVSRKKMENSQVIEEITKALGTQFDPYIGKRFIEMLNNGFTPENATNYLSATSYNEENITDESSMLLSKIITEYTSDIKNTATTDALTKLYNRSFMEERISELLIQETSGALFIIDMDNFKFVNDNFGHITGDQTLKIFADTLRECISENDLAGRLGGDEFIIFIKDNTDIDSLSCIAANIISKLSRNLRNYLSENITSVSIGIALAPYDGKHFLDLYKNADRALYTIKENGKNSFRFFNNDKNNNANAYISSQADLNTVKNILEGNITIKSGAYNVGYNDFQKIYNFISRYIDRNCSIVQIVLFTVKENSTKNYDTNIIDEAMKELESTIISSLRTADITTKYSSTQHIVVLMDSNLTNGRGVAQRIIDSFRESYHNDTISVYYDIESVAPMKMD